jgi:sugar phosphate isomerase/epimerase
LIEWGKPPKGETMSIKISIQTLNFDSKKYSLSDALRLIEETGITHVDVGFFENWQGVYPSQLMNEDTYYETLNLLEKSPLIVDAFNCGFQYNIASGSEEEFKIITGHFGQICRLAKALRIRNITISPGHIQDRSEVQKNSETLLDRLPLWGDMASKAGVSLSLECHKDTTLELIEDIIPLMEKLYPQVGITFDPSHLEMQSISLKDAEPIMKYVMHSHIRGASKDNMQQIMSLNTLDIAACLAMLNKIDYQGCVAIEYFNSFNEGKELPLMIERLQKC